MPTKRMVVKKIPPIYHVTLKAIVGGLTKTFTKLSAPAHGRKKILLYAIRVLEANINPILTTFAKFHGMFICGITWSWKKAPIYHVTYRPNVKPVCRNFHRTTLPAYGRGKAALYTMSVTGRMMLADIRKIYKMWIAFFLFFVIIFGNAYLQRGGRVQ